MARRGKLGRALLLAPLHPFVFRCAFRTEPPRRSAPLSRIVFVNGAFLPFEEARVPINDRGFLFADGIYEVSAALNGRLVDNEAHLARLHRCLGEIRIPNPYSAEEWTRLEEELVRRNGLVEGLVYMQVTRGAAERDFAFPKSAAPTVVMFTQAKVITRSPQAEAGVAVVTTPDLRWKRRDIKSVALLAQVLAKQEAAEAGVFEAWMVEDGFVTEGSSSTAFIMTADGRIVTRPLSTAVLPGITRLAVMRLASERGLLVEERLFTVEEAHGAAEAFLTSASSFVTPVVAIDGRPVGTGKPGPLTRRLRQLYLEMAGAPAAAA
jgi:D-alanine transaminase